MIIRQNLKIWRNCEISGEKNYYKFKFDFEIGYLIKSPCKKYTAKETCEQKTPLALTKAMSSAMAKISEMIIADTYKIMKLEIRK